MYYGTHIRKSFQSWLASDASDNVFLTDTRYTVGGSSFTINPGNGIRRHPKDLQVRRHTSSFYDFSPLQIFVVSRFSVSSSSFS